MSENNKKYEISASDFQLVQSNEKIFDKALDTKPTTFLKDAFKRFCKNKSSIVGAVIIGILVLLALVVPVVSTKNIDTVSTPEKLLPPKLFEAGTGFWDGVVKIEKQPFDTTTNLPLDVKSPSAVKDLFVDKEPTLINQATAGGFGGYVMFDNSNVSAVASDVYFYSKPITVNLSEDVIMKFSLNNVNGVQGGNLGKYAIYFTTTSSEDIYNEASKITETITKLNKEILLKDWSNEYGEFEINISDILEQNGKSTFTGSIAFVLDKKVSNTDPSDYILLKECLFKANSASEEKQATLSEISFSDANKLVLTSDTNNNSYWACNGRKGVYNVNIIYCSYTYDKYEDVYGQKTTTIAKSTLDDYVKKGYCTYSFDFKTSTLSKYKELLLETLNEYKEIKGNLKLPISGIIKNSEDKISTESIMIEWNAIKDSNFNLDPYGNLNVTRGSQSIVKTISATLTLGKIKETIDFEITVLPTTTTDSEQEELKEIIVSPVDRVYDFSFEILDEDNCPIILVNDITGDNLNSKTNSLKDISCQVNKYREMGYSKMPRFLFGTNDKGFDLVKKSFAGLRTSLLLGVLTAAFCFIFGLLWGSISGYFGGTVDILMERFVELLGGIPWTVIMTLAILHLGNNAGTFIMALCLTGWMGTAGRTRTQFYRFKHREYVLASRTLGSSDMRLIFKHILPNSMGTIITGSVLMITSVIFSEANIAYLNLGLQGVHSFGVMMSENQMYLGSAPVLVLFPAVIISLLMISFNLFGNGLRDAFNPSLKGSE